MLTSASKVIALTVTTIESSSEYLTEYVGCICKQGLMTLHQEENLVIERVIYTKKLPQYVNDNLSQTRPSQI